MKKLIVNGTIVDGSGRAGYEANVLIEDEKIVKIGDIQPEEGVEVIDAKGLIVAPAATATYRFWRIRRSCLRCARALPPRY